jgi:hypothetical protein
VLEFRAIAYAAMLAALVAGFSWFVHKERDVGRAEVRQEWAAEKAAQLAVNLEAERMNRMAERQMADAARVANDKLQANLGRARTDAANARVALEQLLNATPSAPSSAASDPEAAIRAVNAAVPWDIFSSCARTLQTVAESADTLEARVAGWQDWYRALQIERAPTKKQP